MFSVRELNIAIELWGAAFCVIGITSALLLARSDPRYQKLLVGMFGAELVMAGGDALAGMFRGQLDSLAWTMTHVGNLATFCGGFALVVFLTHYICMRIREATGSRTRRWAIAVGVGAIAMIGLTLLGAFYHIDEANVYHRSDWYVLSQGFVLLVSSVNGVRVWLCRRSLGELTVACLLFLCLIPALSAVAQTFVYGVNFNVVASVMGTAVVFLEMQWHSSRMLQRRTEELAAARVEASESRIQAMVSQIQPHFLFNTLDTIYGLVDEDQNLAKEAIASFSRYLRTNLDSLRHARPVPIEREMEHVRTYLELERMSDEDRLTYELDMQATGFGVPALSVQTLAENAVKHGLGGRERGGHVTVRTREHLGEYIVAVIDDGVGFTEEDVAESKGVGIANTRGRIAAMCGGTLEVTSEPGRGTTAILHVPKTAGRY